MFLADKNQCDLNPVLSSSYDHYSEEGVVATKDQDLITRELEGCQFSSRETFIYEAFMDHHATDLGFKDPFDALLESLFSSHQIISYYINSPTLPSEFSFLKEFLLLLLYFRHYLLINGMDNFILVLKLLEWLLWKFAFT
jgi:hypothetical protein